MHALRGALRQANVTNEMLVRSRDASPTAAARPPDELRSSAERLDDLQLRLQKLGGSGPDVTHPWVQTATAATSPDAVLPSPSGYEYALRILFRLCLQLSPRPGHAMRTVA